MCVCSPPSLQSPPPSLDFVSGKFFCSFWSHVEHVINAPTPVINSVMENLLIVLVRNRLLLLVAVVVAVAVVVVVVVVWWCFFRLPCGSDVSILERTIFFVVLPTKLKRTMTMNARNVDRNFLHEHQKKNDQLRPLSSSSFLLLFSPIFPREGICVGGRRKPVEKRTARRKRTRTSRGRGKKRKNNQKKATISRGGGGAVRAGQYCRCRFLRLLQAVNGMAPSYPPIRSHLTGLPEEQLTFWRAALLFFHFFYTPIIFFLS